MNKNYTFVLIFAVFGLFNGSKAAHGPVRRAFGGSLGSGIR